MNRVYLTPYSETDERLHAIESLRLKLVRAEKVRTEMNARYWKLGGMVLIFGFICLFVWAYATRF